MLTGYGAEGYLSIDRFSVSSIKLKAEDEVQAMF